MPDKFNNKVRISEAIRSLHPTSQFISNSEGVVRWGSEDIVQPSKIDIDAEIIRLQAEYDAQEYARDRAPAYPSVGDQLDMLMKDMKNGTTTHQEACEAVKDKYPKP